MQSIGFTFDEKILKHMSIEHFFDELPHFDAIEIAPDPKLNEIVPFKKIVSHTSQHHYHVPYFIEPTKYDFANEYYQTDYIKLLSIIESLRQFCVKTPSMIVHGSEIQSSTRLSMDHTLKGIDFLLNFIEQKKMDLDVCIETIPSNYIGSRNDIKHIIQTFDHSKLKACLDVQHDQTSELSSKEFYQMVSYIHLHHHHDDIKKLEHIPMINGHYNIELLMSHCSNYRECLIDNLHYLNEIFKTR